MTNNLILKHLYEFPPQPGTKKQIIQKYLPSNYNCGFRTSYLQFTMSPFLRGQTKKIKRTRIPRRPLTRPCGFLNSYWDQCSSYLVSVDSSRVRSVCFWSVVVLVEAGYDAEVRAALRTVVLGLPAEYAAALVDGVPAEVAGERRPGAYGGGVAGARRVRFWCVRCWSRRPLRRRHGADLEGTHFLVLGADPPVLEVMGYHKKTGRMRVGFVDEVF